MRSENITYIKCDMSDVPNMPRTISADMLRLSEEAKDKDSKYHYVRRNKSC